MMRDLSDRLGFFGDARLDEGGALLLEGMTREESCCLRRAADGERNKILRFNDLMDNDRVSKEAIIEGWSAATAVAAAGRDVLAIQDTSEIKFNRPAQRQSLGQVGYGNVRGVLLHAMIAVDADDGLLIGLVGGDVYTRKGKRTVDHTARSLDDKESRRWIETSEQAAEVLSEARRVTVVADRESDFYPNHVLTRQRGLHILSRAYRDRRLAGGGMLYGTIGGWPAVDRAALEIEAKPGRPARTAAVELRFGPVRLARPHKTEPDMPEALDAHVVEVREPTPPKGAKPLVWRLITDHCVFTKADAWRIVGWYKRRWLIEQLFRTMKSQGLRLEDSQVQHADRLIKLTAIAARAAVKVMQLVQARDGTYPVSARLVFGDDEIDALSAVAETRYKPRSQRQANPHPHGSLAWAAWIIARLGRWDGYARKPPGPVTMRHGLKKFESILIGWQTANTCIP